jgi:predicted nucleic acid-binding Zn ribbon protein
MQRTGRLLGKLKLTADVTDSETRARAAWKVAAGNKLALRTRATALVRGTLIVEVEDIVWQRQLNTLRRFLLNNLANALGEDLVQEIDFRPMPSRRPVQQAASANGAEGIADPVLSLLYQRSKKKGSA